jgi:hypothetical protein
MRELIAPTPSIIAEAHADAIARPASTMPVGAASIAPFGGVHILRAPTTTSTPASPRRPLNMVWTVIAGTTATPRLACRWRPEAG